MTDSRHSLGEQRAVTPVVSNILVVAIVVILAAVVSVFALGIAEDVRNGAPQASFEFTVDDTTGDVIVTQTGGETLDGDQLRFAGAALGKTTYGSITGWAGGDVETGVPATVAVRGGETLRIVWRSAERDQTATIAAYDVPTGVGPTASIGRVDTDYYTWLRGELTIKNIQFSRVQDDRVYVVVEDEPSGGGLVTEETYFSTNGGDLSVRLRPDSDIGHGETITVTVYETDNKSTALATATAVVP